MENYVKPRPIFPKRAVITSGMPYGNKELHFAHVGLVLRADTFAQFMRDRIGEENVVFVSGTDCYGSPALEYFRAKSKSGEINDKSVEEFVGRNHKSHVDTFNAFGARFNLFGASALGRAGEIHKETSAWFINKLKENNMVSVHSSWQFYDEKYKCLLNGRQVLGKCPIDGCQSEKGYADECDLGHQYLPQDLIDPVSTLSGEKPKLVKIENLYFNLENCRDLLENWINSIEKNSDTPSFLVKDIREFFKKPEIFIKKDYFDKFNEIKSSLPPFEELERKPNNPSMTIVFDNLPNREKACQILAENGVRYRTGKTLTPFRLSGDISWGVPCPEIDGVKNQTFYVWPESLWAPISFTKTYLESIGKDENEWKKYWCDKDSKVFQFLGEDNLYFYGPAQQAMWLCTQNGNPVYPAPNGQLQTTTLSPIKFLLYMNSVASSSGKIKPPLAKTLLDYYTPDQFRLHFLAMNLGNNTVSFNPKPFNPNAKEEDIDPVTVEGNLLTNVYNRILRTIFYSTQNEFNGIIPVSEIDESVMEECKKTILNYERLMYERKFHQVYGVVDVFVRNINKYWVKEIKNNLSKEELAHLTANTLQYIYVANILLHPMTAGTERVADYIGFDKTKCFSWDYIFSKFYDVLDKERENKLIFIKEKEDFFKRHQSQLDMLAQANNQKK
jgi:methionyl-tRNA synthetase